MWDTKLEAVAQICELEMERWGWRHYILKRVRVPTPHALVTPPLSITSQSLEFNRILVES